MLPGEVEEEFDDHPVSTAATAEVVDHPVSTKFQAPPQPPEKLLGADEEKVELAIVPGSLRDTSGGLQHEDPHQLAPSRRTLQRARSLMKRALKKIKSRQSSAVVAIKTNQPDLSKLSPHWRAVRQKMEERMELHKACLNQSKPEVGLLIPADAEEGSIRKGSQFESIVESMSPRLLLCVSAFVKFHDAPATLLVLSLKDNQRSFEQTPAEQLIELQEELRHCDYGHRVLEGTVPWAIHEPVVTEALLLRESAFLVSESSSSCRSCVKRVLSALRIICPSENGPVLQAFKDHYGPSAAFSCVWSFFYVQALWMLVPGIFIMLLQGVKPAAKGADRLKFEILKGIIVAWGVGIAAYCSIKFLGDDAISEKVRRRLNLSRKSRVMTPAEHTYSTRVRRLILIFVGIPGLLLFSSVCMFILAMATVLILHIIYVWGDCYNLHEPEKICRDAGKHGVGGILAEIGADVALALLFELLLSISASISSWISGLMSFQYDSDRRLFKSMVTVFLSSMERIGFVTSLAFFFVPQWSEPTHGDEIDMSRDCSDLLMGDSDYRCYQRRLPLKLRRYLLEKLMFGPFVVAPFIAILVKTVIPYAVYKIQSWIDHYVPGKMFCCFPIRFIFRFAALIFTMEGGNVGCCGFLRQGWPFKEVSVDPPPEGHEWTSLNEYQNGVKDILDQAVLKEFTPQDELMELEMSFVWVLFFSPLLPWGVFTTLLAKVLEIQFDQLKMLKVRRRHFPFSSKVMRREQSAFVNAAVLASFGWTLGLSFITYNDDLHKWGKSGPFFLVGMFVWIIFSAALGMSKTMTYGCALAYAEADTNQTSEREVEEIKKAQGEAPVTASE